MHEETVRPRVGEPFTFNMRLTLRLKYVGGAAPSARTQTHGQRVRAKQRKLQGLNSGLSRIRGPRRSLPAGGKAQVVGSWEGWRVLGCALSAMWMTMKADGAVPQAQDQRLFNQPVTVEAKRPTATSFDRRVRSLGTNRAATARLAWRHLGSGISWLGERVSHHDTNGFRVRSACGLQYNVVRRMREQGG
jgi:hypothetical protein